MVWMRNLAKRQKLWEKSNKSLYLKNSINKVKNSVEILSNSLDQAEERISECKGMSFERTQSGLFSQIKRWSMMSQDIWVVREWTHFQIIGVPGEEGKGEGLENKFDEITASSVTEFWERCGQSDLGGSMDPKVFWLLKGDFFAILQSNYQKSKIKRILRTENVPSHI